MRGVARVEHADAGKALLHGARLATSSGLLFPTPSLSNSPARRLCGAELCLDLCGGRAGTREGHRPFGRPRAGSRAREHMRRRAPPVVGGTVKTGCDTVLKAENPERGGDEGNSGTQCRPSPFAGAQAHPTSSQPVLVSSACYPTPVITFPATRDAPRAGKKRHNSEDNRNGKKEKKTRNAIGTNLQHT